jgi:hypothetical protein
VRGAAAVWVWVETPGRLLGAGRAFRLPQPLDQPLYDRLEADYATRARDRPGAAGWRAALRAGAALSCDQAIRDALSGAR